jgi:hypothetical protein
VALASAMKATQAIIATSVRQAHHQENESFLLLLYFESSRFDVLIAGHS